MADAVQNDKSDERFKQLLSAQDNVLKGSATIGQPHDAETTFVYSRPSDLMTEKNATEDAKRKLEAEAAAPKHLVVVPKESRRGGRAYNIHQHVNEIWAPPCDDRYLVQETADDSFFLELECRT